MPRIAHSISVAWHSGVGHLDVRQRIYAHPTANTASASPCTRSAHCASTMGSAIEATVATAYEQSRHTERSSRPAYQTMTGKTLWEQYQHYTRDFTEHSRTLGFAGSAICWIFRDEQFRFPALIYVGLLLFVCFFVADILQSLSGAVTVRLFTQSQEKKLWQATRSIEGEIHKPRWVDFPAYVMFCVKAVLLSAGFVFIGFELLKRLAS